MVKIQEGCNQVCAYCIVPKVRGRERSIPPETLVSQINERVDEGFREVVLTGTQLGTYGFDLSDITLTRLLRRILAETGVSRLRVSSLQAHEIDPPLLELWQDSRMCPHFHIPLQSGSDAVLGRMRRRYTTGRFAETIALVRDSVPGCSVTTDLIVGFPGEGDVEYHESLAFAQAMDFSDMHIFPYSSRPGTTAAYFVDDLSPSEKKSRVARMMEMAEEGFRAFRTRQLGQTRPVLWESKRVDDGGMTWRGLTDNYIRVYGKTDQDLSNSISLARLVELDQREVAVQAL
jgi:threonylcarbamoyladenosine tRNA methylthiotransferase MtaB